MPDRAMEVRHLAEADRHIREGERRILQLEGVISRAFDRGQDTTRARATLAVLVEALTAFKAHQQLILKSIADIDAAQP